MPAVFDIELSAPVKHRIMYSNVIADFGDGYEQRANKNQAYSRADGQGTVTSHKGRHAFTIAMDHLAHVNADPNEQANKLFAFYIARSGGMESFYFYNPAERDTPDLSGVATVGRYLVRFAEQELEREQFRLKLFRAEIAMLEVRA